MVSAPASGHVRQVKVAPLRSPVPAQTTLFEREGAFMQLLRLWAVLGVVLSACTVASPPDEPDRTRTPNDLRVCSDANACGSAQLCVDEVCRNPCGPSEPCVGARTQCDEQRGICVSCLHDGDCAGDATCNAHGECVAAVDRVCTPNGIGCLTEDSAFLCNGDGTALTALPCRSDQTCIDGACTITTCTPNTVVCAADAVRSCNAQGQATLEPCTTCMDDTGVGCTCDAGTCVARSCTPNDGRCVGNSAQRCDARGLEYTAPQDCGTDNCQAGACVSPLCEAGSTRCAGNTLLTCDDSGASYTETSCASTCGTTGAGAACVDAACVPFSASCDGNNVVVCNSAGTSHTVVQDCGAQATCADGECVPDACVPDCNNRSCGPDPVCNTSCGTCSGICDAAGTCNATSSHVLNVQVSWTPTGQDVDLALARAGDDLCDADACHFQTCLRVNQARPDWDGEAGVLGDPLLAVDDVNNDNPETVLLALGGAQSYVVGVHNFGPISLATPAVPVTATVTVRDNDTVVRTLTRTVASQAQWTGVQIVFDGNNVSVSDSGNTRALTQCPIIFGEGEGEGEPADACNTTADCPSGQGCSIGLLSGACVEADCTSNAACGAGRVCGGDFACHTTARSGPGLNCDNDSTCAVGLFCSAVFGTCMESCEAGCTGGAGCCPITQATTCNPILIGVTGVCGF